MAQESFQSRPEFGRTFTTALWVLGAVATLQALAVGWAILTRPAQPMAMADPAGAPGPQMAGNVLPSLERFVSLGTPDRPGTPQRISVPTTVATEGEFAGESPVEPPPVLESDAGPMPGPSYTGPAPILPLSTLLSQAAMKAPPSLAIPDPEVAGFVSMGAEKRASGDMQGALDQLRKAEQLLPEHPQVLAEIAATFGDLGIDAKATLYWERVRDLGEKAGEWRAIAVGELSGQRAGAGKVPSILKLGKIAALNDPAVTRDQGERVVLTVTLEAALGARPNAREMSLEVFFYDLVDGEKPDPTTANVSENFPSKPYDWATPAGETIEVIYHQPVFSEEEQRGLGKRIYYGYIIELKYRDQLQDTAAFPPDLKSLDRGTLPSPLAEPGPPILGPENSLFPSVPVPDPESDQ